MCGLVFFQGLLKVQIFPAYDTHNLILTYSCIFLSVEALRSGRVQEKLMEMGRGIVMFKEWLKYPHYIINIFSY